MRTADFDFELPEERIAQRPADPRDSARLLTLDRETGATTHRSVRDLPELLQPGDLLVLNRSRVIPARLHGQRATGGAIEVLLLSPRPDGTWEALLRPGRRVRVGEQLEMPGGARFSFHGWQGGTATVDPGMDAATLQRYLERHGETPFPPYIAPDEGLRDRYQTVYAREPGSVAAPTAGLHFTPELLDRLQARGVQRTEVVLHVGLGTFQPVATDDLAQHVMHEERYEVPQAAADAVDLALREGRRVVAVGTTSVRVLEAAAVGEGAALRLQPGSGATRIFITPGYQFRVVSALLTNFHLPRSTLLMLVSALAGRERVLAAYAEAVREQYRFYSFGDAMLVG